VKYYQTSTITVAVKILNTILNTIIYNDVGHT